MSQIQLFDEALQNLYHSINDILDSFDLTSDYLKRDAVQGSEYYDKKEKLEKLEKDLGDDHSMVKKIRKEVLKLEARLYASSETSKRSIMKISSFLFIYSKFENHNNELLKIAEKSRPEISERIRDYLQDLVTNKKILDHEKITKLIWKGKLESATEYILRQPDLFKKFIRFFDYDNTFNSDSDKLNRSRASNIIDLHSEIKIRRNILTHNSKSDGSFDDYINQLEGKHGIKNPAKRKKVVERIYGVNALNKVDKHFKKLTPQPEYLSMVVGTLIEIMIIFFYNSFSYTVNINDFPKSKKYTDQRSAYQYSLFGNIINRVNCSYLNLKPINYDNIQLLIDILLLGLLDAKSNDNEESEKKPIYNKSVYNNGEIPWMDYINSVLFHVVMTERYDEAAQFFKLELEKSSNKAISKNIQEILKTHKLKKNKYKDRIEQLIKIINDSSADKNAVGMINSFVKKDITEFIKYYESYLKNQYNSDSDIQNSHDSFEEYYTKEKEYSKDTWFMVKYFIDKNDKFFIDYINT